MEEDDPDQGLRDIEFVIGQTFFDRGHTRDMLKEFVVMKNFEL